MQYLYDVNPLFDAMKHTFASWDSPFLELKTYSTPIILPTDYNNDTISNILLDRIYKLLWREMVIVNTQASYLNIYGYYDLKESVSAMINRIGHSFLISPYRQWYICKDFAPILFTECSHLLSSSSANNLYPDILMGNCINWIERTNERQVVILSDQKSAMYGSVAMERKTMSYQYDTLHFALDVVRPEAMVVGIW